MRKEEVNELMEYYCNMEENIIVEAKEKLANSEEGFADLKSQLIDEFFNKVHYTTDLEQYIYEVVISFSNRELTASKIFNVREDEEVSKFISDVLYEMDNRLEHSNYQAIDKVYEEAGFRCLLDFAYRIKSDLLELYLVRAINYNLQALMGNSYFDSDDFEENGGLDDFMIGIDRLFEKIPDDLEIMDMDNYIKDLVEECFSC